MAFVEAWMKSKFPNGTTAPADNHTNIEQVLTCLYTPRIVLGIPMGLTIIKPVSLFHVNP